MALVRPVALAPSGSQGTISQRFDGQFSWEPAGCIRRVAPAARGKRTRIVLVPADEWTKLMRDLAATRKSTKPTPAQPDERRLAIAG